MGIGKRSAWLARMLGGASALAFAIVSMASVAQAGNLKRHSAMTTAMDG
jgi:hypothetical protein